MKVAVLSDLHGQLKNVSKEIKFIEPELIIVAGDLLGSVDIRDQDEEVRDIVQNLFEIFPNADELIIIPGNHDSWFERNQDPIYLRFTLGPRVKVLIDDCYSFENRFGTSRVTIYGTPRTDLSDFAFPHLYDQQDLDRILSFSDIENNIDILVTHEAPRCIDIPCIFRATSEGWYPNPGNQKLFNISQKVSPKYHIFGHIHCPQKEPIQIGKTLYLNVSQHYHDTFIFDPKIIDV